MIFKSAKYARFLNKFNIEKYKRLRKLRKIMFREIKASLYFHKTYAIIYVCDFMFSGYDENLMFELAKEQKQYFEKKGYKFSIIKDDKGERIVIDW